MDTGLSKVGIHFYKRIIENELYDHWHNSYKNNKSYANDELRSAAIGITECRQI